MPQGLQIFDASGNVIVDTSTYILRELVRSTVSSNASSGSVSVPAQPVAPVGTQITKVLAKTKIDSDVVAPHVSYNSSNNQLNYSFGQTSTYSVEVSALAY